MDYSTTAVMQRLLDLFAEHCQERSTLEELRQMLPVYYSWRNGHDLFTRIRFKTSGLPGDDLLAAQYGFEEICAKTLYNLSEVYFLPGFPGPFDADSSFWIVPIAFEFARRLGLNDREILEIVAPRNFARYGVADIHSPKSS